MLGERAFELCCYRIVMLLLVFENCKLSICAGGCCWVAAFIRLRCRNKLPRQQWCMQQVREGSYEHYPGNDFFG